jgi:predicted nucleic acid-binding protein
VKTSVLVDSNVFLDLFEGGPTRIWSREALAQAGRNAALAVNPIRFASETELTEALAGLIFEKQPIPFEAAFLAGKAPLAYRQAGGLRERTLPDFFIGAHAATSGYKVLTRDASRYRTYFPDLEIIARYTHPMNGLRR